MKQTALLFSSESPMARRHRDHTWQQTPLGPPVTWDPALKTLVPIMLDSNQPMFIVWGESRTLLYNDPYAQILGRKHPDALGKDFLDVWREIRSELESIVTAAYRGQPVQMDDILLWMERHGYREETHFAFFYSPVRDRSGTVGGFLCACTEITAQVVAERRLAESERRHRGVLANMGEAFILVDRDFVILEVNEETTRFVNLPREHLVGQSLWDVCPRTTDAELGDLYRRVVAEQQAGQIDHPFQLHDGTDGWLQVRAFPVDDGLAIFCLDITEQRLLDQEAALSAERVQLALDAGAIIGTWVWFVAENRIVADERFAASFGLDPVYCRAGMPLETVAASIHPADWPRVEASLGEALARGGPFRTEYRVRQLDGKFRWIEANGRIELDETGKAVRFPGVLLDIENRRRAEAERDRATTLLKNVVEAVPGIVYAKDSNGRYLVANRGTADLFGLAPERILGKCDRDILADPEQAEALMAADQRVMESGKTEQVEESLKLADGTPAFWWSTKAPLRNDEGDVIGLIGSSVDITDRKRTEQALHLSRQRAALAMEITQLGSWDWHLRSGLIRADRRSRQICGLPLEPEDLPVQQVLDRIHPDDRSRVEHSLQQSLEHNGNGVYAEEFRWQHSDGRITWTSVRGVIQHPSGRSDPLGTMHGSLLDVTERRQLFEALQQADQRKDEFLAMLAHELRNPLAPIQTAAHVLRVSGNRDPIVDSASDIIARQVGHLAHLVDDLLDVSRVTRGQIDLHREPVDLSAVVSTAIEQADPLMQSRGHALRLTADPGPFMVDGDFHRLVQVVSNLLNNASKYMPHNGIVEVHLSIDQDRIVLQVRDGGVGMSPELLPHVFDLFTQAERTPDRAQGGLGIGLALVRSLVHLHGGEVEAASLGANLGSTFTVYLPCLSGTPPCTAS